MNSTRVDALLDAAEAEFADAGIETGSLRKIMRTAGADPGAVHYHFGGREALAQAVLTRILEPLNARRQELLERAETSGEPELVSSSRLSSGRTSRPLTCSTPARRARPADRCCVPAPRGLRRGDRRRPLAPVAEAFRPHLEAAIPHVPFPVIVWRVRWCVFGTVGGSSPRVGAVRARSNDLLAELVRTCRPRSWR